MNKTVQKIYNETYKMFPPDTGKKGHEYVNRTWVFPHHIDFMLEYATGLCKKHKSNLEICQLAIILHDTGLVYKRAGSTAKGHSERSLEYAKLALKRHKYPPNVIEHVQNCIKATEPGFGPSTSEEKIVRTADAMSKFMTAHFLAKSAFFADWKWYAPHLAKDIQKYYAKICFAAEKKKVEPIKRYLLGILRKYFEAEKRAGGGRGEVK